MSYVCLVALIAKHGSTPAVSTKAELLAEKVRFSPGYAERWHIKASSEMLKALPWITGVFGFDLPGAGMSSCSAGALST